MNKAYRSVWNESSGTWVAVPERASGKRKSGPAAAVAGVARVLAAVGFGGLVLAAHAEEAARDEGTAVSGDLGSDSGQAVAAKALLERVVATQNIQNNLLVLQATQGSGVDLDDAGGASYKTAAYYSQVRGTGNAVGSTPPTDVARANAPGSIAMGSNTQADGGGSTALGIQSLATANDSVALGSGSVANVANTVSVGSDGTAMRLVVNPDNTKTTLQSQLNTRRIVNMAAGQGDTDAVNVGQLRSVTSALGGGAAVTADGSIQAPGYVVSGQTYSDVGHALQAVQTAAGDGVANAVVYDSAAHDKVSLGGIGKGSTVALTNVAAGSLDTASTDAVNGSQLFATNQYVTNLAGAVTNIAGDVTNLAGQVADAVLYDSSTHEAVTLGGTGAPVTLRNVAAGVVSAASMEAVNGAQLYTLASGAATALGGGAAVKDDGTISGPAYVLSGATYNDVGHALLAIETTAATGSPDGVKYDTSAHDRVTFSGGANGTVLSNVAGGALDGDAMNVAQLKAAGMKIDAGGNVTNAFVAYDDTSKATVTLGGGANGTKIANLAAGNVAAASREAVNGAQLYSVASGTAASLGGGAAVDANGTFKGPSYVLSGATYGNVGEALQALETTATTGSPDGVKYDTSAHERVTFSGANGTVLSNVAGGALDGDAVNVAQLRAAGLKIDTGGNVTNAFVAYDDASKATVTLGGANGTKIANLAAGSAPGDAVNAGQLAAMSATLGGGAGLSADGSIVAPAYHMQGGTQRTVGNALDTLDSGLTSLQQQISGSGIGLVEQDPVSRAITVGAGTDGGVVNFTGTAGSRVLTGVAAGAVSASSADAVNGAQLYAHAASAAAALGGGASVHADGTIAAPAYSVGGTTVNNVGAAITNLDGRITQNTADITNLQTSITNIAGTVANAVQYDSSAHDKLTLGGQDASTAVKLTNLADADLSASSTDAVTGAQLYATNVQVANLGQAIENVAGAGSQYIAVNTTRGAAVATGAASLAVGGGAIASGNASTAIGDQAQATGANAVAIGANSVASRDNSVSVGTVGGERQITNVAAGTAPTDAVNLGQLNGVANGLNGRIDDIDRSARRGIAASSALNIVTPYLPGRTTMNAGVAAYRGQAALGVGVSRWNQKGNVNYNLGVSSAGGNSTIVRAGVGIVFGG
ncbi:YadA-like family protein [Paraburkholderia acidisoli]|nr:YadA-like family protein [Paraburkholderia acidisoli]